jgi:hypothetical protein
MRKYILPSALILACFLGAALSQNINRAVQLSQDPTGLVGYDTSNNIYVPNHLNATTRGGPAPVLSACITGGTPTLVGTDFTGTINAGSTASTSCVVTFGTPFIVAPRCVVAWSSGPLAAMSWTTSTTALTITQTSNGSSIIQYICTSSA